MANDCPHCRRHGEQFSEFTQIVSHDLQSPVKKIISFLDLLQNHLGENFDEKSIEYLGRITKNAAVLSTLLKKLRDYAHFSSLKEPIQAIDLNAVFQQIRNELKTEIDQTHASISCPSLPTIQGRPEQISTLWKGLLQNAIVHHGPGVPHITVGVVEKNREWHFSIADDGIGIDPVYHEKIFQLFARMAHHEGPSTGIGLAISKKIVENHGGKIGISANSPHGSTFSFTLPRD